MEEKYNWITAVAISNGKRVSVRQQEAGGRIWVDMEGLLYNFVDLDFTQVPEEPKFVIDWKERMRKSEEEHERTQKQLQDMFASMDTKAIADHQSLIDERAYWRKLRGDIFLEILRCCGDSVTYKDMVSTVKFVFESLYEQDKAFFDEKSDKKG